MLNPNKARKRPGPRSKKHAPLLTADQWRARMVQVHTNKALSIHDTETTVAFGRNEHSAEVSTSLVNWMRAIESAGGLPNTIHVYGDGEVREYLLPKGWILPPSRPHKVKGVKKDDSS